MMLGTVRGRSVVFLYALALAGCTAAHAAAQPAAPGVYAMSPGRLGAIVAVLVALAGVIIGGLALARSGRPGTANGRLWAFAGMLAGLFGMVAGGLIVATAAGGVGAGKGVGGALVAVVVGLVSLVLGALARARSRSTE